MGNKAKDFRLLVKATKHFFFSIQWIIIGKTKQNRTNVSFAWENKVKDFFCLGRQYRYFFSSGNKGIDYRFLFAWENNVLNEPPYQ